MPTKLPTKPQPAITYFPDAPGGGMLVDLEVISILQRLLAGGEQ